MEIRDARPTDAEAAARRFYLARSYVETGAPDGKFGTSSGLPMSKPLS